MCLRSCCILYCACHATKASTSLSLLQGPETSWDQGESCFGHSVISPTSSSNVVSRWSYLPVIFSALVCFFWLCSIFLNMIFLLNKLKVILAKVFLMLFGSYFPRVKCTHLHCMQCCWRQTLLVLLICVSSYFNIQALKRIGIENTVPKQKLIT